MLSNCPCCSNLSYINCCQPFHLHIDKPVTPAALMRSRYSAYALHLTDYLLETTHLTQRHLYQKKEVENWAKSNIWLKLEICEAKGEKVEFKAYYQNGLNTFVHHEISIFKKKGGIWYYLEGSYPV